MSRIQRVYVDTSVYGGYFDKEFAEWTEKFFEEVDEGKFLILYSDLLDTELKPAPMWVKDFAKNYLENAETILITKEVVHLGRQYILNNVVGETSWYDCVHIATASIAKADLLVSWNFKHIVNSNRIEGYNSVNRKLGYSELNIRTPREVLHYE
ncbi:hypothetical protein [Leptospira noguchii]|uniref:hypothetical protein n=1 Tax=Leptospira noguchii TaxID=28182 RepID=UPI0003284BA0|nr:hypothetical protein [Leptospira noguchii]EMS89725.1 hypothetical protein LEP1GSC073_0296 [Leptospira noguchii str. Cascata]